VPGLIERIEPDSPSLAPVTRDFDGLPDAAVRLRDENAARSRITALRLRDDPILEADRRITEHRHERLVF